MAVTRSPVAQSKDKRLNLRATSRQERLIRAGAQVLGVNLTSSSKALVSGPSI